MMQILDYDAFREGMSCVTVTKVKSGFFFAVFFAVSFADFENLVSESVYSSSVGHALKPTSTFADVGHTIRRGTMSQDCHKLHLFTQRT